MSDAAGESRGLGRFVRCVGLRQNYPNPFQHTTSIGYSTNQTAHVILEVYDACGRKINTLVDEHRTPGTYQVNFDASDLSPGLYTCKFTTGSYQESKHLLLMNK